MANLVHHATHTLAGCKKLVLTSVAVTDIERSNDSEQPSRMRKKAVPQGHSERRGESYSVPYVEPLSEATTPLVNFFRTLPGKKAKPPCGF